MENKYDWITLGDKTPPEDQYVEVNSNGVVSVVKFIKCATGLEKPIWQTESNYWFCKISDEWRHIKTQQL